MQHEGFTWHTMLQHAPSSHPGPGCWAKQSPMQGQFQGAPAGVSQIARAMVVHATSHAASQQVGSALQTPLQHELSSHPGLS
jgi:hypothetical protein